MCSVESCFSQQKKVIEIADQKLSRIGSYLSTLPQAIETPRHHCLFIEVVQLYTRVHLNFQFWNLKK